MIRSDSTRQLEDALTAWEQQTDETAGMIAALTSANLYEPGVLAAAFQAFYKGNDSIDIAMKRALDAAEELLSRRPPSEPGPRTNGFHRGCSEVQAALADRGSGRVAIWQRRSHTDIPESSAERREWLAGYAEGITHTLTYL